MRNCFKLICLFDMIFGVVQQGESTHLQFSHDHFINRERKSSPEACEHWIRAVNPLWVHGCVRGMKGQRHPSARRVVCLNIISEFIIFSFTSIKRWFWCLEESSGGGAVCLMVALGMKSRARERLLCRVPFTTLRVYAEGSCCWMLIMRYRLA